MTQVSVDGRQVHIDFPGWEAIMVRCRSVAIPLRSIRDVRVESGWTSEALGMRVGLGVPGYRKLGTFRHSSGTRRLVSMTRGLPLLRLGVDRSETGFDEILLSTPDAGGIAAALPTAVTP